jgi:hypothetical protein
MAAIRVIFEEGEYRYYPICEECGQPITDAQMALVEYLPDLNGVVDADAGPFFLHKGICTRAFEAVNQHLLQPGQRWYSEEFADFLALLGNNAGVNWGRLAERVRLPGINSANRP